jgi:hypothetical protein
MPSEQFFTYIMARTSYIELDDEVVHFGISFSKFPVSRHLLKLFYDELCSFSTLFALNFDQKLAVE